MQEDVCCVCGEKHGLNDLADVEINGKMKKICNGCADAVHGFA